MSELNEPRVLNILDVLALDGNNIYIEFVAEYEATAFAYVCLQHAIGKEVSRFEQGRDDFIENIDDAYIRYDGGRVVANESLIAEIKVHGLRKTTRESGLDRKTIRAILNQKKVKVSTLAKVAIWLRSQQD